MNDDHDHEPKRTYRWPDDGLAGATCRHCGTDYALSEGAVEGLRLSTMHRLDVILGRLAQPGRRLEEKVHDHRAYHLNLGLLKGLGFWDELNTYFSLFQVYLRREGSLPRKPEGRR